MQRNAEKCREMKRNVEKCVEIQSRNPEKCRDMQRNSETSFMTFMTFIQINAVKCREMFGNE